MKADKNDATQQMKTLSENLNKAASDGYKENFKVQHNALTTEDGTRSFKAEDIAIDNFYRYEGYSDPQDNAVLYLIKTSDGTKGALVDAYGAYADAKISAFIKEVEDIHKKAHKVVK